jgi:hypothetical protein
MVLLVNGDGKLRPAAKASGELPGGAEEEVHTDGEVGAMEQRSTPFPYQLGYSRQRFGPAGGAGDGGNAEVDQAPKVRDHRVGTGELDRNLRSGEPVRSQRPATGVFQSVHLSCNGVAPLHCQSRHGLAHLAAADNGDAH